MLTRTPPKLALSALALVLSGCFGDDDDDDEDAVSTYVAVGNSLTSGFQSGGLREDWQLESYPALIARQMDIGNFQQPLIDSPGLGTTRILGLPATPLEVDPETRQVAPRPLTVPVSSLLLNSALPRPYDNLGVPGATTLDFLRAYDSNTSQSRGNGFFNIVLRSGLFRDATMLRQAVSRQPKVMTVWIGNNDILGGVTSGTIVPGTTVTPVANYAALMDLALDTLLRETDAHLFLANIPSITSIPYVTALPRSVFDPATFRSADTSSRLLTEESDVRYVLIPALGQLLRGVGLPEPLGTGEALGGGYTLTGQEVAAAEALVDGYNEYLREKAEDNPDRITLVDVHDLLGRVTAGQIPGLSAAFPLVDSANTTVFSYDGIHPNAKGYREVANLFLEAMNASLDADYPLLD